MAFYAIFSNNNNKEININFSQIININCLMIDAENNELENRNTLTVYM